MAKRGRSVGRASLERRFSVATLLLPKKSWTVKQREGSFFFM